MCIQCTRFARFSFQFKFILASGRSCSFLSLRKTHDLRYFFLCTFRLQRLKIACALTKQNDEHTYSIHLNYHPTKTINKKRRILSSSHDHTSQARMNRWRFVLALNSHSLFLAVCCLLSVDQSVSFLTHAHQRLRTSNGSCQIWAVSNFTKSTTKSLFIASHYSFSVVWLSMGWIAFYRFVFAVLLGQWFWHPKTAFLIASVEFYFFDYHSGTGTDWTNEHTKKEIIRRYFFLSLNHKTVRSVVLWFRDFPMWISNCGNKHKFFFLSTRSFVVLYTNSGF